MTFRLTTGLAAGLALATALTLSACGESENASGQSGATASANPSASASTTSPPDVDRSGNANFPEVTGNLGEAPTISAGTGDAPTQVSVKTLSQGNGAELTENDGYLANYSLALWDGTAIQNSFASAPMPVKPSQPLIPGWTYGVLGQHVGDRIEIVIPPQWGYGDSGSGTPIPGGSTLVFVIDILDSIDPSDVSALQGAQVTGDSLPEGVAVSGDLGSEPTLELTGTDQPTEDSETIVAAGTGAAISQNDSVVYREVGGYYGDSSSIQSSWSGSAQFAQAGIDAFVGKTVGSRVLFVLKPQGDSSQSGATTSETATRGTVLVVDIIGVLSPDAATEATK